MKSEIREICGDWALDIDGFNGGKITIYFNSRQNALTVKRILEVDDSIPNAAIVCDMQEVVRCKNCKHFRFSDFSDMYGECSQAHIRLVSPYSFCSYGERKDEE